MADMNEPKKPPTSSAARRSTKNVALASGNVAPAAADRVRPPAPPPSVAPKPLPPPPGGAIKPPLAPPMARPPAVVRPPTMPTGPPPTQPKLPPLPPPAIAKGQSTPIKPILPDPPPGPAAASAPGTAGGVTRADSPMKAMVRLGPIQPPSTPSASGIRITPPPPPVATPAPVGLVESVPAGLCWGLVGVSSLILSIQLWAYFS